MKNALLGLIALLLGFLVLQGAPQEKTLGSAVNYNYFSQTSTSGLLTMTESNEHRILATSTEPNGRRWVSISVGSNCGSGNGTGGVLLGLNNDITVTTSTASVWLPASSSPFIIDSDNLYTGSIRAIGAGTCEIHVVARQ